MYSLKKQAKVITDISRINNQISDHQQNWGMRMAPGKGWGHLCWWSLIYLNS
jgi:hypothetical protein